MRLEVIDVSWSVFVRPVCPVNVEAHVRQIVVDVWIVCGNVERDVTSQRDGRFVSPTSRHVANCVTSTSKKK